MKFPISFKFLLKINPIQICRTAMREKATARAALRRTIRNRNGALKTVDETIEAFRGKDADSRTR